MGVSQKRLISRRLNRRYVPAPTTRCATCRLTYSDRGPAYQAGEPCPRCGTTLEAPPFVRSEPEEGCDG
jgi:hypothetical protein